MGLGVETDVPLEVGDVVRVELDHGGQRCGGMARVQGVREGVAGKHRCGLHAVEAQRGAAKSELQKALEQLSATVQREQLRRMART